MQQWLRGKKQNYLFNRNNWYVLSSVLTDKKIVTTTGQTTTGLCWKITILYEKKQHP
jgi:hypothetical protein